VVKIKGKKNFKYRPRILVNVKAMICFKFALPLNLEINCTSVIVNFPTDLR